MKLAILGDHAELPAICAELKSHGHQVVEAWGLSESHRSSIEQIFPSVVFPADWSVLMDSPSGDVIAVLGTSGAVLDAARKLATENRPLLVDANYEQGLGFIYELALVHDDNRVPLLPWCRERFDPHIQSLRERLSTDETGEVQLIEWVRRLRSESRYLDPDQCEQQLLSDVDLLRQLGGDYNQITALESVSDSGDLLKRTVTLAGPDCPDAQWTIIPDPERTSWNLDIRCVSASFSLEGDATGPQRLTRDSEEIPSVAHEDDRGWGRSVSALERSGMDQWINWTQLIRNFETVDATRTSLRRRRTIDLYFETASELSQFKTQMTAIGCGVLSFTLFGLVVYLAIASVFTLPGWLLQVLRLLWLLPLVIFLVLQLLVVLARPSRHGDEPGASTLDSD